MKKIALILALVASLSANMVIMSGGASSIVNSSNIEKNEQKTEVLKPKDMNETQLRNEVETLKMQMAQQEKENAVSKLMTYMLMLFVGLVFGWIVKSLMA